MPIIQHPPAARGVNQLMYVGDDQAVETAARPISWPVIAIAVLVGWWLLKG